MRRTSIFLICYTLFIVSSCSPAHADYDDLRINLRDWHYGITNSHETVNEIPLGLSLTRWFEYHYIDVGAGAGVFINSHRDPVTFLELSASKKFFLHNYWIRPELAWMNHWGYNRDANNHDTLLYPAITAGYKHVGLRYMHFTQQKIGVLQLNWGLNF